MPPKKRTACNPRKPRLAFLESPQEGPVHEYGAVPPAAKTKCVPTKPLDHDAATSWVTSQFDQAVELRFPPRRRSRRLVSGNSTAHSREVKRRTPDRKQSVCKFPPLAFTTSEPLPSCPTRRRRAKQNSTVPAPCSPPSVEGRSRVEIPSPPDVRTPETKPTQSLSLCAAAGGQTPLSRTWAEPCDAPSTTPGDGPGRVLAEDTPEQEYGVRLTWRRRQELMRYLKSRGRLKSSQILVKR
ncbi:positive regulation of G0 to G1 transition [Pristimantis euphronides]